MDKLQNMRAFVRVAELRSFTRAAKTLQTTTANVSRAISDLETQLRARLFNRTTRRIVLTEVGERYLRRCEQALAYVDEAEAEARDAYARPSGRLKVYSMVSFGQHYVMPTIARYQKRYPDVRVEIDVAQRIPDMLEDGYDVSLVLARELPDSTLVSHRLGSAFSIVCGSPAYLADRGVPESPSDLANHNCLQLVSPVFPAEKWVFEGPNGEETVDLPQGSFQANSSELMAAATREGMGLGLIPAYAAMDALRRDEIRRVLPDYTSQEMTVFALYHSRQYLDAKIRTWVDFLREELPSILSKDQSDLREHSVFSEKVSAGK